MGNNPMGHPACEMRKLVEPQKLKELILNLPEIPASVGFLGDQFSFEEREEIKKNVEEMFNPH